MPTFTYQARDESGRLVKGALEADSQAVLAERLRKMGYLVTRIEEAARGIGGWAELRLGRAVSGEDLLLTCLQLSALAGAGVPLTSSLKAVSSSRSKENALRQALEGVTHEVESGSRFSQALACRREIFPELMVSLVEVGEATGKLDLVLSRFARFLEKDLALRREIQGALTYPLLLLAASSLLILFVVSFVVPQFALVFLKAGIPLPAPTRFLQWAAHLIQSYWWALGFLAVLGTAAAAFAYRKAPIRLRVDRALLTLPAAGPLLLASAVARFCRTLATLAASGVAILTALRVARRVVGNRALVQEVERVGQAVERGERIAAALSVGRVFSADAIQMIRVGEESGRLDEMLEKVADFYELKVSYTLKQMTTLLEPALLVVMGGVTAFIMASLLLPMFDMVKVLQHGGLR
ncbi:MAG: type II secretion system F family protein [Candidatus Omnitrophica bacterium]|nr:type II secretion system F family protein [Candidatus Omnitrophota bacterium]